MGVFLSSEEKKSIREIFEETNTTCSDYCDARYNMRLWRRIFPEKKFNTNKEEQIIAVIKEIELWMSLFPKMDRSINRSALSARIYELLCEDVGLNHLGVKMILEKLLLSKKIFPTISEISTEANIIKNKYSEFLDSYERLMRDFQNREDSFVDLFNIQIGKELDSVINIRELIKSWNLLFYYDPFPGTLDAKKIIDELSKPWQDNPLLFIFITIVEVARIDNIKDYNMLDIYEEMHKKYPEAPFIRGETNFFFFPEQWKMLYLSNLKVKPNSDYSLFCVDEFIIDLISNKKTDSTDHVRKLTCEYFLRKNIGLISQ